jgi:ribosomal protein S18 acetylase RimI-like enzyme
MKLRPATGADAVRIHEIHTDAVCELCANHYSDEIIEGWLKNRSPEGYLPPIERGDLFVILSGDRLVGFGEAVVGKVIAVFVSPEYAGQGFGAALLREAMARASQGRNSLVRLESTLNARKFYEQHGFKVVSKSGVIRNGIEIPVLLMECGVS